MKQEALHKANLMLEIRNQLPKFVSFRLEDKMTKGIPDIVITGRGKTTWWEAKHGTPDFDSYGLQELTMLRLAGAGVAYYIIWLEKEGKQTLIVHPRNIQSLIPEISWVGFNHKAVVEYIRAIHYGEKYTQ